MYSRLWLGYWIAIGFCAVVASRIISYGFRKWLYSKASNRKRILLIGDSTIAESIATDEKNLNSNGFRISGFCQTKGPEKNQLDSLLYIGRNKLLEQIEHGSIEEVWICLHLQDEEEAKQIVYELRHTTVNIRQLLKTPDLNVLAKPISEFNGISTLDLSCSPHRGSKLFLKNIEDYSLGLLIFILLIPAFITIGFLVKTSSPGPILFKQYRHGIDGRKFKVYKFRTMEVHEEIGGQITQATRDDPRVTQIGKFLRRTSLDELPQFFNVLQGRMSIVGPRPHALAHNRYYSELIDSYMRRHLVKPGITGWAQVNGHRGETDSIEKMAKRVEYDLYYIENWSIQLDLKILFMTPMRLFTMTQNAY